MSEPEQGDALEQVGVPRLRKLASKKRFHELELEWTRAVEDRSLDPFDLVSVLGTVARGGDLDRVDSLLWFLLTAQAEREGAVHALALAKAAAAVIPESRTLREELSELYRTAHSGIPEIEALTVCTLSREEMPLLAAIERLEKLIALRPGRYVLDRSSAEVGRVIGFDRETGTLTAAFRAATKSWNADSLDRIELLEDDDWRALALFDRAKLEALAAEDPPRLVALLLKASGSRLPFRTLKTRLADIVPSDSWAKWWAKARPLLRRDPLIEMSEGTQPTFALRQTPITYEDRVKAQFSTAESPEDKLLAVLDYLDETNGGATADATVLRFLATQLGPLADAWIGTAPGAALGALALCATLRRLCSDAPAPPDAAPRLAQVGNPAEVLRTIRDDRLARSILALVRDAMPERWAEWFAESFPGASPAVCEFIAVQLEQGGRANDLLAAVAAALSRSESSPGALIWLWKGASGANPPKTLTEIDRISVAAGLLSAANKLAQSARRSGTRSDRTSPSQIQAALLADDLAAFRDAVDHADIERANVLKSLAERNAGLTEKARGHLIEALRRRHPGLFVQVTAHPWEDDCIYTTQEGFARHREQLSELVNVKMPEIAKAIGAAAAMGDLSENAEFTSALEERDRLATRAARMQQELNKARLIPPDMPQTEWVTVGSAVRVRDLATGREDTYRFLGPWDANVEKGIYSYHAPLGLAFMGKKVGDKVTLRTAGHERSWEILEIRSGL